MASSSNWKPQRSSLNEMLLNHEIHWRSQRWTKMKNCRTNCEEIRLNQAAWFRRLDIHRVVHAEGRKWAVIRFCEILLGSECGAFQSFPSIKALHASHHEILMPRETQPLDRQSHRSSHSRTAKEAHRPWSGTHRNWEALTIIFQSLSNLNKQPDFDSMHRHALWTRSFILNFIQCFKFSLSFFLIRDLSIWFRSAGGQGAGRVEFTRILVPRRAVCKLQIAGWAKLFSLKLSTEKSLEYELHYGIHIMKTFELLLKSQKPRPSNHFEWENHLLESLCK